MRLPAAAPSHDVAAPGGLTRQQKATIIVRLLQAEGMELSLADLPDDLQVALANEMSAMRYINRSTLDLVVAEFVSELEDLGLTFPRSVPHTLDVLQPALSDSAATKLRKSAGVDAPDNPWEWLGNLPLEQIAPLIEAEAVETAAVALSKLNVTKSAEIIGHLPGERARRIAYTMSRTTQVSPDIVQRIGDALVAKLQNAPARAFDTPPAQRVGSILNYARAATRDDVLESLLAEDQDFGEAVKRAIFTFKDICRRVDPRDVPKVMREIDQAMAIKAFAAAQSDEDQASVAFLLDNMSQRLANAIREEAAAMDTPKAKDGEVAQNEVIAAIRVLHENGEIAYRDEDESEAA